LSNNTLDIETLKSVDLDIEITSLEVTLLGPASLDANIVTEVVVVSAPGTNLCVDAKDPTQVVVAPTNAISVVTGIQGPAGTSGTGLEAVYVPDFDTSGVTSGRMVYVDDDYSVAHTDAAALPGASAIGHYGGTWGRILAFGVAPAAAFVAASPTPAPNDLVFLARADTEADAEGKLTTAPPTVGFVSPVGLVVSVPGDYLTSRTAEVMVRVQNFVKKAV